MNDLALQGLLNEFLRHDDLNKCNEIKKLTVVDLISGYECKVETEVGRRRILGLGDCVEELWGA